jgi:hypothetical protein
MTNWYVLVGRGILILGLAMLIANYVFYSLLPKWFALYDLLGVVLLILGLIIRIHGYRIEKRKGA